MSQNIIFSKHFAEDINKALSKIDYDRIFVLTDNKVDSIYHDFILSSLAPAKADIITIPEGDENKCLSSLTDVWKHLGDNGASRHSLLINIGGGMVTDLGGFAASTFKRGISFINVPTTLLSMVDASTGGKTGINFNNLKNEVGVFSQPECVIIDTSFLKTLDNKEFLSGYAEMLKHSLIDSTSMWADIMNFDLNKLDTDVMSRMISDSVMVKSRIVTEDPYEKNIRKILNLGHTFGHAFETFSYMRGNGIPHGYAVAYGLVCELYLSYVMLSFPTEKMHQTVRFIHETYGRFDFTCKDYDKLLSIMMHDKKNCNGIINFALLKDIGKPQIDCHATKDDIFEAFDFLREGM